MKTSIISSTGTFVLDCSTTEQHTSKMRITENPVESGANVADHAILEPIELNISGVIVSYTPPTYTASSIASTSILGYQLPVEIITVTANAERIVNTGTSYAEQSKEEQTVADFIPSFASAFNDSTSSNRIARLVEQLRALQRTAETLTVQTQIKQYKNMLITSIATTQTQQHSAQLTINLKEIFVVESKTSTGISVDTTRNTQTQNLGRTQPKEDVSILERTFGA